MQRKNSRLNLATFSLSLYVGMAIIPSFPVGVKAEPSPLKAGMSNHWEISQGFSPPNVGAPPATAGGGARSSCVKSEQPLTALMPAKIMPLTVASQPTFFVYVPKTDAQEAEFILKDENEEDVYRNTVSLPKDPGIVRFDMQSNSSAPNLTVGQNYHWYFSLICKPQDRREDIFVDAWIRRIDPAGEIANVQKVDPKDLPKLYAKVGIWHEALSTLADLRKSNPNDNKIVTNWKELLDSVGLEKVSSQPLVK